MRSTDRVRPLRVAIVGAGMIGAVHRRAALLAGASITAVLTSTPDRSAAVAADWGVSAASDVHELAESNVDLVHVASPNVTHAPYVRVLLDAGKHVVCEKPLGLTVEEARSMAEAAEAAGVVATVPYVYRYHPLVREIRDRAQRGEFGRWNLLHGSYLQDWMSSPTASSWRVDPRLGGASRAFADIGSHWCDLVEWVSGEQIAALSAQTSVAVPQRPAAGGMSFGGESSGEPEPVRTEDSAVVLLRTAAGVLGTLTVSQVAAGRRNRLWFELDGSLGSAVFDQENPEQIWLGGLDGVRLVARDPTTGSAEQRRLSTLPAGHAQGYAQCFEAFVADTYAAVDGDKPDGLPTFTDGLRSAQVIDAVLRSAATTEWEEVG
jgi:predicted dehydrogenase